VKGVILAAAMCVTYLLVMSAGLRLCAPNALRARLLFRLFLLTLPICVVAYYATPPDLGFLPSRWLEASHTVEFGLLLFVYASAFLGGILQLYNLADRGLSLRIAMDLHKSPSGCMTPDEVTTSYSAGKGIVWMYQKRIEDLKRLKLAEVAAGEVRITPAGMRVAQRFAWLREFLRVTA
jgi:hypothetical protein